MMKGSQGFTLVEVMIVMGITSVIALAMATMIVNQSREQKALQTKATFNALVNSVTAAANSPNVILNSGSANAQAPQNVVTEVNAVDASN